MLTHSFTQKCAHTFTHTQTCSQTTFMNSFTHEYIHALTYSHIQTHPQINSHTSSQTHPCSHIALCINKLTFTVTHALIHKYTNIHLHRNILIIHSHTALLHTCTCSHIYYHTTHSSTQIHSCIFLTHRHAHIHSCAHWHIHLHMNTCTDLLTSVNMIPSTHAQLTHSLFIHTKTHIHSHIDTFT